MKVGDLVKYKDHPENGYGIVLKDEDGFFLMYWIAEESSYNDYTWENPAFLEVISESR